MKRLEHKILDFTLVVEERKAVNATLYANGRQVESFSAVCNPVDTYDFLKGVKKAVERVVSKTGLTISQQRRAVENLMKDLTEQHRLKYAVTQGTGFFNAPTVLGTQHTIKPVQQAQAKPGYIMKGRNGYYVMTHKPGPELDARILDNPSDLYLQPGGKFGPPGSRVVSYLHPGVLYGDKSWPEPRDILERYLE